MLNDDSPLNTIQLANYMLCCRATIGTHKRQGYQFEIGTRTTAGHYKTWLRQTAAKRSQPHTVARRRAALARLR